MTMRYRAYAYTDEANRRRRLEEDVRRGLTANPKTLPPKYFYDAIGSKLFEDITKLPEYYLTRTEAGLLEVLALLHSKEDRFLVGLDLVKDVTVLEAAYNDASGVTREFNRNILEVVNRGVGADFRPSAFQHVASYDEAAARIEMHLVPGSTQQVRLGRLGLTIRVSPGESIRTERCYKFSRASAQAMLEDAGLRLERWHVDPDDYFALAVAAPG